MRRLSEQRRLGPTIALTLLVALLTLTPLAYAVPPDPVWVSGYFDDDDNDNGAFFITSGTATLDPFPLYAWGPFPVHVPGFVVDAERPGSPPYASTADARASPSV